MATPRLVGWLAAAALLGALPMGASAQDARRSEEQLRRLRQQLQQVQQERDAALAQASQADAERQSAQRIQQDALARAGATGREATRRAAAAEQGLAALRAELAQAGSDRDAARQRATELDTALATLRTQSAQRDAELRDNGARLAQREAQWQRQQASLAAAHTAQQQCEVRAESLYQQALSLLDGYSATALWRTDRVLRLQEVAVENQMQSWRERLDSLRRPPDTTQTASQP